MRKMLLFLLFLAVAAHAQRAEVAPFLTSKWGQGAPYNQQCPNYYTNNGNQYRCQAGCVAVAMAQAMYYYRYPAETQMKISGYTNLVTWVEYKHGWIPYVHTATLESIKKGTQIEWDNMLDAYSGSETPVQKSAVSTLMMMAGESVVMRYDRSSSADPRTIVYALTSKFGYDESASYVARKDYSDEDWTALIYGEVAAGRPVIYGGLTSLGNGHSFLIDGYRDGLFHVNWGSDGYNDGYFSLNQLDPYGGTSGYNREQDAIIGIRPKNQPTSIPSVPDTVEGDNVYYDLHGRRLNGRPQRHGLYIVNGRKVML